MAIKIDKILGDVREGDNLDTSNFVPYSGATGNLDLGEFNLEAKVVDAQELSVGEVVSDLTPQVDMGVSLGAPNAKYLSVVTSELAFDSDIGITVDTEANSMNVEAESVSFSGDITANNLSGTNTGDQDLSGYQLTSEKGQANGYASLDAGGKVPVSELPNSIMQYVGVWDASTNSPTLADGAGNDDEDIGDVYRVSVGGTQNLGSGNITFNVGDYVILNYDKIWEKSDTTDSVASVFGRTGVVTAQSNDYTLSQIATRDHDLLSGLTDDDHTQYALLAGRSGGQTLTGGTASANNLTLQSTSNATKGKILFGTSAYDEVNNRLGIGTTSPQTQLDIDGGNSSAITLRGKTSGVSGSSLFNMSSGGRLGISVTSSIGSSAIVDIDPQPGDGTSTSAFRFFRLTNTSGAVGFTIYKGDNTTTQNAYISGKGNTFFVLDSGNVGIGMNNPASRLVVKGTGNTSSTSALNVTNSSDVSALFVRDDGLVGIGTTSPSNLLTVGNSGNNANTSPTLRLQGHSLSDGSNPYGSYGSLLLNATSSYSSSARRFLITNALNFNKFAIIRSTDASTDPTLGTAGALTSGTADFVINNGGNVGIGTTSPVTKLDVEGTVIADNYYTNTITLNDDKAGSHTISSSIGFFGTMSFSIANLSTAGGLIAYRTNNASGYAVAISIGSSIELTTGTLADGAGTDGKLTISADTASANIYFSNRTGATRSIKFVLF